MYKLRSDNFLMRIVMLLLLLMMMMMMLPVGIQHTRHSLSPSSAVFSQIYQLV